MKRFLKSWTGQKSPSPRKTRPSRRRHTSRRADVRDHELEAGLPELVPLTFLGYQYLPDGTLHPVYSAMQTATHDTNYATAGEPYHNDVGVSSDKLVESQHFCFKCGKARSKRYHMDNPIKPGSTPPASCCSKCRRKNTNSEPGSKYLQHFCVDCGRVRSRFYHKEHPVRAGHQPRPSYCLKCRTRREEEARGEGDWEDIDASESSQALPRMKTSASKRFLAKEDGPMATSDFAEDDEFDDFSGRSSYRRAPKEPMKLSVPATSSRKVSRESVQSTRSYHSVEEAPPTPPHTPSPIIQTQQPAVQNHSLEKKVAFEVPEKEAPTPSADTGPATDRALVTSAKQDCKSHVHVVYIHPPCYHHGHDDHEKSSRDAVKACCSRRRRSDSDSTATTSSKQSKRVAFATPEVSSRHEADADYDRTAVPENHEDPFDFGLDTGPPRSNYQARGFNPEGRPRRSPTPGPMPRDFDSSSGRSSSEYGSSSSGFGHSRMDAHSPPPPEYDGPPPKVLTPDEIRRLWEQGPQPEHPHRRQAQAAERGNNGPMPAYGFSSHNREDSAANRRSFSEGNYPSGFDNRPQQSSNSSYGNARPANPGAPDYRASDNRRASDGRYRNDENIDPKTRYNSSGTSRPSQSRGRDGPSQQSANMYNTNRSNEYSNPHQSESRGPRPENNPNMYNNQTSVSSNHRPSQSRTASSQSENNPSMYNNSQPSDYRNPRPSGSSQSDRPRYQNDGSSRENTSRHSSTTASAPAQEAPFTARERMWTDGPEQARKLRESLERLERAAAASRTKTAANSPPTPNLGASASASPVPASDTNSPPPAASTPDSATFGSSKRDFTSSTTFNSSAADFGSDTRNYSSSTRRDFSPDVPPAGFASTPPPFYYPRRTTSASTWEHPCGPFCNDFCSDRVDHVAREIVEIDSDEEKEILLGGKDDTGSRTSSTATVRRVAADRSDRLALVPRRRPRRAAFAVAVAVADDSVPASPAQSAGSDYYTASETSC